MPAKKKTSAKKTAVALSQGEVIKTDPMEETPVRRPSMTQVVEVIDDAESKEVVSEKEALETIKRDAEEIEEAVETLEEVGEVSHQTESPKDKEKDAPTGRTTFREKSAAIPTEEQKKEMVDELFSPGEGAIGTEISMHTRSTTKTMVIWGAIVIGIAVLTGGVLLTVLSGGGENVKVSFGPTPTPTPEEIPTPTPTPEASSLKQSDLTVAVINGGGKAGAGSKMKAFLEGKGYVVKSVGNAEEYTFETTEILVKSGKEGYLELLKADLGDAYKVEKTESTLPEDSPTDARVTVGKE